MVKFGDIVAVVCCLFRLRGEFSAHVNVLVNSSRKFALIRAGLSERSSALLAYNIISWVPNSCSNVFIIRLRVTHAEAMRAFIICLLAGAHSPLHMPAYHPEHERIAVAKSSIFTCSTRRMRRELDM